MQSRTCLFHAEQQRRQEAETFREATAIVATTLERERAIELILEQLAHVLPYDSASVQLLREGYLEIVRGAEGNLFIRSWNTISHSRRQPKYHRHPGTTSNIHQFDQRIYLNRSEMIPIATFILVGSASHRPWGGNLECFPWTAFKQLFHEDIYASQPRTQTRLP